MTVAPYEGLIELIYDAVFDESAWLPMVQTVDAVLGTAGCHMALLDPDRADPHVVFSRLYQDGGPAPELEEQYLDDYFVIDERVARMPDCPVGEPLHNRQIYTRDEMRRTSATYNDFLVRVGGANQICVRLPGSGSDHDFWTLTRRGARDYGSDELDLVRRLAVHVGRLVRMRRALSAVDALGLTLSETLDQAVGGAFLLDATGRIVECNDRGRALLAAREGLTDTDGVLGVRSSAADHALQVAIRRASPVIAPGEASAVRIPAGDGTGGLSLHVSPVPRPAEALSGKVAVLVVARAPWGIHLDPADVSERLGISASEAEVAVLLAGGRTVGEIATLRHRTVESVRWHLKQMYGKLGVRRQAELVRTVLATVGQET